MDKELLGVELRNDLQERIMKGEKQPSTKVFKLLYQATRDGCSVEDFQQKCKEKTPTLTVLYGSTGTIFGGYTSKPWISKGNAVIRDPSAFLFYCHQNNHMETLEMNPKNYGWAITCNSDTGPSFGGGKCRAFDLQVFKKLGEAKKFECEDGYFRLNGSLNLNCTYVSKDNSFRRESINAGALYVKDIEVYEVCKDTMGIEIKVHRRELLGTELQNALHERIMKGAKNPSAKVFKLLYQASKDGCSVEDFQQNCKERSPTLTVLYGSTGTIFGGYTSKPWTSKGKAVIRDPSAFLFCCHQNNHMETLEMNPTNYGWAITCNGDTGPSFGGGKFRAFDLQVFKKLGEANKFECEDGYFRLNGSLNLNCTYVSKDKSFRRESINAGELYVKDVEVYEVCEDTMGIDIEVHRRLKGETTSRNDRKGVMLDALKKHIQTHVVKKNVSFRLLFQAKKDGCNAESFHKKCDATGRTLTVMCGRKYFYGGFTAVNWQSGHQVRKQDKNAFLFCQNVAKNDEPLLLRHSNGNGAIICDSTYGPTFGCSDRFKTHDFQAFRGNALTEQYEYGYFYPSSSININNTYTNYQVRSKYDYHGGDKYVYDIEVYAVEDEIEYFPNEKVDKCKTRKAEYCTERYGVNAYNILLAGPIGVGKTSFCRSLDVAYAEKLQHEVGPIASRGDSVTKGIFQYTIRPTDSFYINVSDIRGIEDNRGYFEDFGALLDGKLIENYQFPDANEDLSHNFLKDDVNVKPDDRIHALCIVLDATKVDIVTPKTLMIQLSTYVY